MGVVGKIFGAAIGLAFGLLSGVVLIPAFAAFQDKDNPGAAAALILVPMVIGLLLGLFAPSMRRVFGRSFLMLGLSVLALPLSAMLLSGRAIGEVVGNADAGSQGAAAVGAGLAGVMVTGVAAFVGFFLGAVLIIIGLVLALGGRREVVVVNRT